MKVGEFCITLLISALLAVLGAFVASKLWLWFVVPLGAAPLGMAMTYGLVLTVKFFTGASRADLLAIEQEGVGKEFHEKIARHIAVSMSFSILMLAVGWFVKTLFL